MQGLCSSCSEPGFFRCGHPPAAWRLIGLQGDPRLCACGMRAVLGFVPGVHGWSMAVGLWAGQPATEPGAHPPEVSGVGAQSTNLAAHNRASGEHWGCLSHVHSPAAEGGGAPEAAAAMESSLTSH